MSRVSEASPGGTDVSGCARVGTGDGHRSASVPSEIVSGLYGTGCGPSTATGTEVTARGRRKNGERSNGHVHETYVKSSEGRHVQRETR